jgi:protein-disulfide isomerase
LEDFLNTRRKVLGHSRFIAFLLTAVLGVVACAPSAPQLKKVIEDNPDILYAAMRKDPVKFLEVVNEVAEKAKTQKEEQQFEDGFKNPMKAEIDENRMFQGPKTALVTIIEYSDFQCPYCQQGHATMKELLKIYDGKIRVTMKNYPIDRLHPQARKMSHLFEAMGTKDQAKAIQFQSALFERQSDFAPNESEKKSKTQEEFIAKYSKRVDADLAKLVKSFGFDYTELKKIADSEAITKLIEQDGAEAQKFGFSGTPGYLVNGVAVRGAYPVEAFKGIIDRHLGTKK